MKTTKKANQNNNNNKKEEVVHSGCFQLVALGFVCSRIAMNVSQHIYK